MRRGLISVIVPAYRQEKTIVRNLRKIVGVLKKIPYHTELICVVDGMVDQTYSRAKQLIGQDQFKKKYRRAKVYGYETNKGKGYAVRFGMAKSKGKIIAFIDAGFDINPNGLLMCLEHMEWYKADIIVGSKRHQASKILTYPWQRRALSFSYQVLVRLLFGLKIKDTQTGIKFYKREVLEKVLPRLLNKAFAFDIEILSVAYNLGFTRIFEAPIELKMEFEASTIASKGFIKISWWMLWETIAIFYRLSILNYYSDENNRKWRFDPELQFRINIG